MAGPPKRDGGGVDDGDHTLHRGDLREAQGRGPQREGTEISNPGPNPNLNPNGRPRKGGRSR